MTTLEIENSDVEIQIKILSKMHKRQRRTFVRAFLTQIKPIIKSKSRKVIYHSSEGALFSSREFNNEVRCFKTGSPRSDEVKYGYEVRMKRLSLGLTQAELAKKLNLNRAHLSDLERGLYSANTKTKLLIETELGSLQ